MAANLTLDEFLKQLASQHGLHRKVRVLARYWRQVQSLPPEGRERVALALGSRAAWNRLEKLFNRDGTLSEGELAVKRALDSVGGANPSELRALASRVRSGDYAGIGKDLVDVVGKALDEEAAAAEPGTVATEPGTLAAEPGTVAAEPGTVAAEPGTAAIEPGTAVTEQRATAPQVADGEPEAAGETRGAEDEREAAASRTDPEALAAGAPAADRASARSELVESEEPDEVGAAAIEFEAEDQLTSTAPPDRRVLTQPQVRASEVTANRVAAAEPPNEPSSADETPWEGRAPGMVTLSARECLAELRRLRNERGYGAGLGHEGRVRLLQRLGSGWAGRRGLSQLIRSGSIRDVDEALQLIDGLGTPVQRTWCLGDLVEHWKLRANEAARILDAAPSPAARRRLQRRAESTPTLPATTRPIQDRDIHY